MVCLVKPNAMIKPTPKSKQKSPYFKDNFTSSYLIIGANFSEARVRRNSGIRKIALAILHEMISSRTVKIHI